MSVVSSKYIGRIPYTQADKLQSVKAQPFLDALELFHKGKVKVQKVVGYLLATYPGVKYEEGLKAFQARFQEAIGVNGDISGEDQKYIADITHRIAMGELIIS